MDKTFYMVFLQGGNSPTHQHLTPEVAEAEAKRLAKLTGRKAFVLCTVKSFEVNEFTVKDLRPKNEDLPF